MSTNPFDDDNGTEEHWTDLRPRSLRDAMALD